MNYVQIINKTLRESFNPTFLEVIDESELHRGHTGFKEGTQTHFKILISAKIVIHSIIYNNLLDQKSETLTLTWSMETGYKIN